LETAKNEYPNLIFLDSVFTYLLPEPFSSPIAKSIQFQLKKLHELTLNFDQNGQRTNKGHEIINNYFQKKDKAIFSDESETNKKEI
jgi:hypothetical protein